MAASTSPNPSRRRKGEGSVRERSNGRWEARYRDAKGRAVSRSFRTQAEASAALAGAQLGRITGEVTGDRRLTLGAWLDRWMDLGPAKLRPTSQKAYRHSVAHIKADPIARTPIVRLVPSQVDAMVGRMLAAGLSPATVGFTRHRLGQALKVAVADGLANRNVVAYSQPVRRPARELSVLTDAEIGRVLAAFAGQDFEPIIALALGSGLRQGEILGLSWSDLHLDGAIPYLEVRGSLDLASRTIGDTKSAAGRRRVNLDPVSARSLRAYRAGVIAADGLPAGLVFRSASGGPVNARRVLDRWYRIGRPVLDPRSQPFRFHDLRHTAITRALRFNHPKAVARWAGHSHVSVTLALYGHPEAEDFDVSDLIPEAVR